MSLTITIPGAVNVTTGSTAPAVLTIGVGVPGATGPQGPAGPGVPAGGTAGQYLQKIDGTNYNTDWVTVNLAAYAVKANNLSDLTSASTARTNLGLGTMSTATAADYSTTSAANLLYYPLSGNPSSFLTTSTAASTYQTLAGMSDYLAKAGNLAGLANTGTARTNLGLGSLAVVNDAPSDGSQYARRNAAWEVVSSTSPYITSVSSPLSVTSGNLTVDLSAYAPLASPVFTGDARAVTPTFGDNDTSIATTAFVQAGLAGGTAVAKNLEVYVRNQSGASIPAGSIVYISGATGNRPLITLSQANNDANSAQTMGFTKTAIANNDFGYVIVRGELENIDTSALTEGVQLYLSPTTAGTWTTTKPSAPQHLVYVGIVMRAHPTLGTILVAVQNGYELGEIHDVALGTLVNNDLLAYESSTDLWKNKTYSALGLLTTAAANAAYMPLSPSTISMSGGSAIITFPSVLGSDYSNITAKGIQILSSAGVTIGRFQSDAVLIPSVGLTFSDASVQTTAGISSATAASTYQTISGMSAYAPLASPALTGNVTITSNTTGAALFIEQAGTGNILTLHDQASDTNFVAIDANGKVNTVPAVTGGAGFNIPHGTAPTTFVDGDIWTTTGGLFARINGSSNQIMDLTTTQTISGAKTFSNANQTLGNSTAAGTIAIGTGATVSGSTRVVNIGTASAAGSTNNINIGGGSGTTSVTLGGSINLNGPISAAINNISLGTGTAASVYAFATGATTTGLTKAVTIGTGALAGATTTIAIGSTTGTSTTTLQGITNGVTAAADTNSVALATTAFVVGQAGSVTPLVNGTAAVGTSLRYARQDHVHGTDTTRAAVNSQVFTGTPTLPTGTIATTQTAGNNTTAIATTAFVTAAVPAAATHIQSLQFSSTSAFTRVIDASSQLLAPSVIKIWPSPSNVNGTSTSGAGASAVLSITGYVLTSPSAGVAGSARCFFANSSADLSAAMWGGTGNNTINFGRRVSMAFRFSQFPSSTASVTRIVLGKIHGAAVGDLASAGIGVKYVPNGANFDFQLQVHNGTTLTNVTSSTQYAGGVADLEVVSDGAGNAVLYLNGNQVASTTGAPTGVTGANATVFAEVDSTASTANQPQASIGRLTVNTQNF
jgi:hypothetical protein